MRNILDYIEKIKQENEGPRIMAQETRNMDQASLADDLEPGALKDEMLKDFDPSQETYEEYLRRKSLGERPFNMAEGGRIGLGGGGFAFKGIRALYKGKKGLQEGAIRKKLVKEYKEKGASFDVFKVYDEAKVIVDDKKLDIVQDAMTKVDIRSDDYIRLMDEQIRLTDYEMYKDIKRWDEYRPDLADKTRALHFPEWAAARFGDNYDEVLLRNQARALKAQSDEIDKMYPDSDGGIQDIQQQTVTEIDEMNKANIAEVIEGKKKHAIGGRVGYNDGQLVTPSVDGSRPGYAKTKITDKPFDVSKVNLTEYEKKLIRNEFLELEFKFNKKQPIGLKAYKNAKNYKRVVDFIKRDFKTTVAFEPLSLSAQREVMREFDLPKGMKWNFKKYRYGISDGRAKGEGRYGGPQRIHEGTIHKGDRKLVRRIAKFLSEPETSKTRYWGRVQTPGGSMIHSVDRAVLQGNENYKLKIIDGRVAGFIDKTVLDQNGNPIEFLYKGHGEKRLKPGQKLITSHPLFKKYEKFFDITKDATKSLDNTSRVFQKLFEGKGFDTSKIRFTDLVRFLGDETSKWQIENSVVKHHKKGVKSSPLLAKDLQIVTQVNNQYAEDMAKKIRNKKITPDDLADIKRRGVRFQVDGKWYGVETGTTPGAQFKKVVQSAISDVKKWKPKDFKEFNKFLQPFCGYGKSTGGRIGFGSGSCSPEVAKRNFILANNDVRTGRVTGEAAEQIKKQTKKVVAKAGSKSALTKLLGPAGIGLDVLYEAGSVITDIYGGTPWREALQDNWIAGAFMPGTSQEEFHKSFFKKHPEAKPYGSGLDLEQEYYKTLKKIERLKANTTDRGKADAARQLPELAKDLTGIAAQYNALGNATQPGSPEYEAYMAAKTEYLDAREATSPATAARLKMELNPIESDRFKSYEESSPVKMDFSLPGNYTTFKPDLPPQLGGTLPTKKEINELYTKKGYNLSPQDIDFVQKMEKWNQLFNDPENRGMGIRGTQDWRGAGGGMAGIRRPSAIPPESGPQSQGLASLKKYGSYY